jgi:signal transduction histidine kinase/ligand-binding sensor domain-containing protein
MVFRAGHTLLVTAFITMISCDIEAQSFNPNYHFKHLNIQNGLTQNIVYHFLQDSRGYIWIGTHYGLSLFDGLKTTNFLHDERDSSSIARNFISGLLEDSAQQVWVSNENGIDRYNRADNSFTHFGVDRPDGSKEYTYCVVLGFVTAHELWFLETRTRSIRILNVKTNTTSFVAELDASHAYLYKGSAQTVHLWSTYDMGTIHQVFKDKKLISQQTYFAGKNGPLKEPQFVVIHVLQQNDSTVWISTNEGLVKLNPQRNTYQMYNRWKNKIVNELRYAAFSPNGQLWVASGGSGIYTFDVRSNKFIDNFRNDKLDPYTICSDNIVSLYFDKAGNIWCGSYGNGSSYAYTENTFFSTHISKNEARAWNSNNSISWLGTDGKNLWYMLSDNSGFWILDKEFRIRMHKNPVFENGETFNGYLNKILFDKAGNIWCATNKGLFRYDISTGKLHPVRYELFSEEVMGSIWIKDILSLHDSSVIFSTYAGLYHVTNERSKSVVKLVSFLGPGVYNGFGPLFQDKKNLICVKTLNDTLYILKPRDEKEGFDLIKSIWFLPDINHYFSEDDDSLIHMATTDGLYHLNTHTFKIDKESFSNGIPFLNVSSVFKNDNKYWVFGEKGLYLFDVKSGRGETFTVEDGLPANEFTSSALVLDANRRCIAGTSNGLVSFFPGQLHNAADPPLAQLTGIYINDVLYASGPASNEVKNLDLSFRKNTFSFDFSTITFHHPAACSFEYKLDNYDEDWIKSGNSRYTRYSRIPPGNYVFNVRVIDASGKVSSHVKTIGIQVSRPFWQTTLFKIAALAIILGVGWLIARWYLKIKMRKQKTEFEKQQLIEKERTRIATDMHDDLGAGLSRIRFLSQSILNKKINDETITTELEKITSFSDEMSEKMGEIVWALNEKNDTLADLVAYTRSYAMEYLANHHIECEANTPLHLPGTFITGEMRRDIFLSAKECLHNIVKHSGATKVCFSVELKEVMKIVIHDNGKGIDWDNRRAFSNGIENIKRRMKDIKGDVSFENDQGTKVSMAIPIVV